MSFEMIIAAIGSLGFPIVACCAMAYFFAKTQENISTLKNLIISFIFAGIPLVEAITRLFALLTAMMGVTSFHRCVKVLPSS